MSNRLNQEKEKRLEPIRIKKALYELGKLGYACKSDHNSVTFNYYGFPVVYFPYSGWASGKTIKDGRGLRNLLKQISAR